jgi:hypothetical protein
VFAVYCRNTTQIIQILLKLEYELAVVAYIPINCDELYIGYKAV